MGAVPPIRFVRSPHGALLSDSSEEQAVDRLDDPLVLRLRKGIEIMHREAVQALNGQPAHQCRVKKSPRSLSGSPGSP